MVTIITYRISAEFLVVSFASFVNLTFAPHYSSPFIFSPFCVGVRWVVRGSSKMARGAVHPSDVLRALMVDLEAIGIDSKGADTDRKLAEAQMSSIMCSNPFIDSSLQETAEGVTEGNKTEEHFILSSITAINTVVAGNDEKIAGDDEALKGDSSICVMTGTVEVEDEIRNTGIGGVVGGEGSCGIEVADIQKAAAACDSAALSVVSSDGSPVRVVTSALLDDSVSMPTPSDGHSSHVLTILPPSGPGPATLPTLPSSSSSSSSFTAPLAVSALAAAQKPVVPPLSYSKIVQKKSLAQSLTELSDEHSISRSASAVSFLSFFLYSVCLSYLHVYYYPQFPIIIYNQKVPRFRTTL